jgi:hypothetical protein
MKSWLKAFGLVYGIAAAFAAIIVLAVLYPAVILIAIILILLTGVVVLVHDDAL